ncbi:ribosome recycling factor [Candidatus Tachikawaea gelatinosa]|uniref:Ribosome-recycling factor n=1 Tax=Candidatus Tachikawaea gelatinosa TaxID=1410383 RepID=A0A090BWD1_9ENTR|nr:ribosome recycling factor [Candidatus Tachikawaea gelatinosa]BAP58396.1 ribosome-recycling factor [Candidatus Tachikawaea gelatinosa]
MIENINKKNEEKMKSCLNNLKKKLNKIRTGRASTSLIEDLVVDYYGVPTFLYKIANISVESSHILKINIFDHSIISKIEKAISLSNLGITPNIKGNEIRLILPSLTEERRKNLIKIIRNEGENSRIAIRNVRRDANEQVKKLLKNKLITEDKEKKLQENIQKQTNDNIKKISFILSEKEKELMNF